MCKECHIVCVEMELKDREAIQAACKRRGLPVPVQGALHKNRGSARRGVGVSSGTQGFPAGAWQRQRFQIGRAHV